MTIQVLERKLKPYEEPLEHALLKWLYLHLPPQLMKNRQMYRAYIKAVGILMREQEMGNIDLASQRAVTQYLSSVIPFIEEYEKKEFSMAPATPEEMLQFLMEENELSQYDLTEEEK